MPTRVTLALALAAILAAGFPGLPAQELPKCTCVEGNACYHYLGAPVSPPDDPCSCPRCRAMKGSCASKLPEGWSRDCANSPSMACFLRRHAFSWRISCSERLRVLSSCKGAHPEWCPCCGEGGREWDEEGLARIRKQVEVESRLLGDKRPFVVVNSPHFYLVTDIPHLRMVVMRGGSRQVGTHELAHIYVQRAELTLRDLVDHLGGPVHLPRPAAVFLLAKEPEKKRIAERYLGHAEQEVLYGADAKSVSGGLCYNACAISKEKYGDDDKLHYQMRHLLGHQLMSCWVEEGGSNEILPKWMHAGSAHWLARLPEKFHDEIEFCSGEAAAVSASGRQWRRKARAYASDPRAVPIQRIFDAKSLDDLSLEMHVRAWSWFDVFLAEDRERFIAFLSEIRRGTDQRAAVKKAFGCEPEELDERWRDRMLGRRPTVAATPAELDAADPARAGARERWEIRRETDLVVLASKVRALEAVDDPLTAATIVPLLSTSSDLLRENIVLVLSATRRAEVRAWLRTEGLEKYDSAVRAQVARVLGNLRDEEAAAALVSHAGDKLWLTRANVARALGRIGHAPSIPLLVEMLRDRSSKVRMAAMDALALFGSRAASGSTAVAKELDAKAWQVRSAAAGCLGRIGSDEAVEPLIDRMEAEGGRLRDDIREALKRITKDDLGRHPEHWREWWEKEKARRAAGAPGTAREPPDDDEYARPPTYYGLEVFSRGVGYVLDTSSSMVFRIKLDPGWLKRHKRDYPNDAEKYDLAKSEIAASLRSLDPRTRFNLYFFRSTALEWKSSMVPATPDNVDSAIRRVATERPSGQLTSSSAGSKTNYVDAFRLVLDVKQDEVPGGLRDTPDTVFFLTDGKPTEGDITETGVLLRWFRELNRFARIKVNVITFGHLEVDPEFLRALAEENGGRFVQVPSVG